MTYTEWTTIFVNSQTRTPTSQLINSGTNTLDYSLTLQRVNSNYSAIMNVGYQELINVMLWLKGSK